eukprot:500249_1
MLPLSQSRSAIEHNDNISVNYYTIHHSQMEKYHTHTQNSIQKLPEFTGFFNSPQQLAIYHTDPHISQVAMDQLILKSHSSLDSRYNSINTSKNQLNHYNTINMLSQSHSLRLKNCNSLTQYSNPTHSAKYNHNNINNDTHGQYNTNPYIVNKHSTNIDNNNHISQNKKRQNLLTKKSKTKSKTKHSPSSSLCLSLNQSQYANSNKTTTPITSFKSKSYSTRKFKSKSKQKSKMSRPKSKSKSKSNTRYTNPKKYKNKMKKHKSIANRIKYDNKPHKYYNNKHN